jgi:uncharacterized protein YdhG (YjbR/CyaY superfamily)
MKETISDPDMYIATLPEDKKEAFILLRKTIKTHIPKGFEEVMAYGMISYVVPLKTYPAGYHCNPKLPLMFASIACQKNFISLHHLGIYGDKTLVDWFVAEYPTHCKTKLDMGKGCIRFKKPADIPFDLVGALMAKMTVKQWIERYEQAIHPPVKARQKK